jgi:hypothetical protein
MPPGIASVAHGATVTRREMLARNDVRGGQRSGVPHTPA